MSMRNGHVYALYIFRLKREKMCHVACAFKKHVKIKEMQAEVELRVICHVLCENPLCDFWYHFAKCQDISAKNHVTVTRRFELGFKLQACLYFEEQSVIYQTFGGGGGSGQV